MIVYQNKFPLFEFEFTSLMIRFFVYFDEDWRRNLNKGLECKPNAIDATVLFHPVGENGFKNLCK